MLQKQRAVQREELSLGRIVAWQWRSIKLCPTISSIHDLKAERIRRYSKNVLEREGEGEERDGG